MGSAFAAAAVLTGVALILGSTPSISGPLGPASQPVLALLAVNMVLIIALAVLMGWRMLSLLDAQSSDAGARLHLRFVALFALAAVAPAVIVALFFGALVTRGVENWFSTRVQTVVENSATVARSYVEQQINYIGTHAFQMSRDIDRAVEAMSQSPVAFGHFLTQEASDNGFEAAYIIDGQGQVLARAEGPDAPAYLAPPPSTVQAAGSIVSVEQFPHEDRLRGLLRLQNHDNGYIYVVRRLDTGILRHLHEAEGAVVAYREARDSRTRIEAAFALSYAEMALLVLLGAVWLGMGAASGIAGPVARLVQAAGRVSAGDLTARVDTSHDPEEIAVLSRAFNRMTTDLQVQQDALKHASEEAEARSEFIEAVLLGVSAGVIGLDAEDRISAVNLQAQTLLHLQEDGAIGQPISQAAPELEGVVDRARTIGADAEEDVDVVRGAETRRLRVRASPSVDGLVLTFDDITRLLAAQRNAAWKDVARRIAHEIKNPLTPIQLSAERLRRKYRKEIASDLETFDRCTDTIIRQVGDIGRMVDEFSAFARMPAPKFAEVDAVELVRQAVFAQRVADPEVTIDFEEPAEGVVLVCDARMVGQALANVLKNAGEAIGARRAITPEPGGQLLVNMTLGGHDCVIAVEDNGIGLPVRDRDRLTEPYVTTREKGTGLGLAIVKRILEEHGGHLELCDARTLSGARVELRLPGAHPPHSVPAVAAETSAA
jgi:two-component system nitrogen regulation sensor histidine kinase NtrY